MKVVTYKSPHHALFTRHSQHEGTFSTVVRTDRMIHLGTILFPIAFPRRLYFQSP